MSLLLLAIFLTVALTSLFFGAISAELFTRIKVRELQPKAEAIAQLAYGRFLTYDPYFDGLMHSALELFDAYIFVVDGTTGAFSHTTLPESANLDAGEIEERINQESAPLLNGQASSLWFTERFPSSPESLLFVGVPITSNFLGLNTIVGTVFFVKPMQELNASLRSMYVALILSALAVAFFMLMPAYLGTIRVIRPLKQTRDVALAMASGEFGLRADDSQEGEIGELASTMNHLADNLAQSISALTLERNRLKQVLDGISEGIVAVDTTGRVTMINEAMIKLSRAEMNALDSLEPGSWQQDAAPTPMVATGLNTKIRTPDDLRMADGLTGIFCSVIQENKPRQQMLYFSNRSIALTVTPLEDALGRIAGAVGLFRDVTETERLEQTRKDYVANVSHELRTPLTAMRALIEPLKDGMVQSPADRDRYYDIMLRETLRLSRLIDDMLELSRLQGGTISFDPQPFSLHHLIRDLHIQFKPRSEQSGINLDLDEEKLSRCPDVMADPDRIEQVLVILMDNAFKFTQAGGTISIDAEWGPDQVRVHVKDNGVGIDPDDIDHVFDRFYKADKSHHLPGTGLGLSIAREILVLSGEQIHVRSNPGQGTVFTFTLKRAKADHGS